MMTDRRRRTPAASSARPTLTTSLRCTPTVSLVFFSFSFFHDLNDLVPNLHLDSLAYQPESELPSVRKHVLPFDLDVIHTRVKYWVGDAGSASSHRIRHYLASLRKFRVGLCPRARIVTIWTALRRRWRQQQVRLSRTSSERSLTWSQAWACKLQR